MKRLPILITIILLFTATSAFAEYNATITGMIDEFEIRSGIKFMMTKDEVSANEKLELDGSKYSTNKNHLDIYGSLAGIDNASGEYIFDNDWKLTSFQYYFGGSLMEPKPEGLILSEYDTIEKTLAEKYGSPLDGISAIMSDDLISNIEMINDQRNAQLLRLSERLLKINSGGYVKIEHWAAVNKLNVDYEYTSHYVQYTYFTDDYFNFVSRALQANENQKNNDL